VTERLHRIRALAAAMSEALRAGDLPGFGALLDENWQLKRGLARGVTSAEIDHWYATARAAGVYGGKISGAGGGGFFLFCVPPARWQRVVTALQQEGLDPFPVAFDHCGCVVREEPILAGLHARHGLKGGLLETVHPG
jgi:D-glycero-alpha-D-manno-heptose-7-phosphate kinase